MEAAKAQNWAVERHEKIIQACNETTEDMCRRVIKNITVRVEKVARRNGAHLGHLFHRG
jgi:peptide methionine sulfoxide reductase MsrB